MYGFGLRVERVGLVTKVNFFRVPGDGPWIKAVDALLFAVVWCTPPYPKP